MSFSDRLRAWFKGETKRAAPGPSTERASRASTRDLADFAESRHGVEAFVEPRTALYSTTLLLIAHDGEYLRRPVSDPKQAATFCERHEIPIYDARKVGYPRRMRDYEQGTPQRGISLEDLPPWPGSQEHERLAAGTDSEDDPPWPQSEDEASEPDDAESGDDPGEAGPAPR